MIDTSYICGFLVLFVLATMVWYSLGSITGWRFKKKFKSMPAYLEHHGLEMLLLGSGQTRDHQSEDHHPDHEQSAGYVEEEEY